MKINGIGQVNKEEVMSILTREGRDAVKAGEMTLQEVGEMYKLSQIKKASRIGSSTDTFQANYNRIPASLQDRLAPEDLGRLVDAFYECYGAGKNARESF